MKVFCAASAGLSWRVERETQKGQPPNSVERLDRSRRRCHAPAKRLAARDDWQLGNDLAGPSHRGPHGRLEQGRSVRPPPPGLHIGELIAERGNAMSRERSRDLFQKPMPHARPGTVGHHIQ
jgi:hypothetical protein